VNAPAPERRTIALVGTRGSLVVRALVLAASVVASVVLFIGLLAMQPPLLVVAAAAFVPAFVNAAIHRTREAEVTVAAGELVIGRGATRRAIRLRDVEHSLLLPGRAELGLRGGREVTIAAEDVAELMDAFGLRDGARALAAPLRATLGAFTLGLMTFTGALLALGFPAVMLLGGAGAALAAALATSATVVIVRRFGRPRVVVGTDGVRVVGTTSPAFVSFAEIVGARRLDWSVEVARKGKPPLVLPTIGHTDGQIAALVKRIQRGVKLYGAAGAAELAALERQGRDLATWRAELAKRFAAGATFREQALSRDVVEAVLDDAKAPPERRIGAALALRVEGDEAASRIRIAADACANEELREALAEIADDTLDEARVMRALKR
jgi:hypothetical protein